MKRHDTPGVVWWLVLLAAAGAFALTMGTRQTMGFFLSPLNTATGLGVGSISLAFAFGQLWWGLTQPFAGAVADRVGAGRVLLVGVLLVALGTFLTPFMTTTWGLILAIGVLAAGGAGMAGPSVLMAATARLIPAERRGMATGVVNAGGSFGQFLMAPLAAALTASLGWAGAMQALAFIVLLALPAAWVLRGPGPAAAPGAASTAVALPAREAIRRALNNRSYLLLSAGFLVCGFHVAFLATHLPGVVAACGLPAPVGAWALGVIGLFNIVGSLAMGWAVGRWRMKSLLSLVYASRAVAVLVFLLAPKTEAVLLVFATGNMAMLFGLVMLSHQVGGFLGAWLGGQVFEATGNYDWVWYIDIVLAVGAALVHLPIEERAPVRPQPV
jgi:predicted MFS family arabinose efflux permease